ncbi:MAG TPA: PQQ-binding-like beta-propeller repeat protein [Pyrinomonadaceae bacterium]|nr:PQQ-binding-like beta-propeller repeat protein [Pyrinomonadaceae bacterium]
MNPKRAPRLLRVCRPLALLLSAAAGASVPAQQPTPSPTPYKVEAPAEIAAQTTEFVLRWKPTPRVRRYRLQVARDPEFSDIVFDGAVNGLEHRVTGLPPGRYHWRVAPAPKETGRFSSGEVVEAAASSDTPPTPYPTASPVMTATPATAATPVAASAAVLRSPASAGWQAAVGKVQRPVAARLRPGQQYDLVAVNSDGTVYALEGANGAALWTARYRPAARGATAGEAPKEVFTPLVYNVPGRETAHVLVAFDGGVRMIEGETGRELWRAPLKGRAAGGSIADLDGKPETVEIAISTDDPSQLYMLDAATGGVVSQTQLGAAVIGLPIPFQAAERRGVIVAADGGRLDIYQADGTHLRGVRLDVPFVTPPLVVAGPQGTVVVIGTRNGVLFFDGPELKPVGRITTENDSPRGRLAAADLDGDGTLEIALITRLGRVVVVNARGRINWSAEGGSDAYSAVFADLDRDGVLDVLVADGTAFARGYSGRDGRVVWQADDAQGASVGSEGGDSRPLRTLWVTTVAGSDSPLIVGADAARGTVRAVGMPVGGGRATAR